MGADNQPRVSVVIPLHDKRATVLRAVRSVLTQSFEDLELLVIDDGSTDGSAVELQAISDPRLRMLRTGCRGPGAARNHGASFGRAPWLAFLDADDEWQPTFLRKAVDAANASPAVVLVFCDVRARGKPAPSRAFASHQVDDYFEARVRHKIAVSCSSNLVRADVFAAIGGFPEDYAYGEDIDTWLRLACRGPFYFISEPLCTIDVVSPGSLTFRATPLERAAGLQRLLDRFAELERQGALPAGRSAAWDRFMSHQRGRQAVYLASGGRRMAALRTLARVPIDALTWRDWGRCLLRVLVPRPSK